MSSFSSFFHRSAALERLESITSLGYESEEMSRRLQLIGFASQSRHKPRR